MTLHSRVIASCISALMLAAACGGSTGDGTASSSSAVRTQAAAATQTQTTPVLAKSLVVLGDTIRSQQGLNDVEKNINAPGIHCTQQSRFPQGGRIVWRMKALDPLTGKYLDDKDITSFTITFPDGKSDKFAYGAHGGTKEAPQDFLWAYGWTVPNDWPTGALSVKIEAKSVGGAIGAFDGFKVTAAQLTITKAGQDYPRQ